MKLKTPEYMIRCITNNDGKIKFSVILLALLIVAAALLWIAIIFSYFGVCSVPETPIPPSAETSEIDGVYIFRDNKGRWVQIEISDDMYTLNSLGIIFLEDQYFRVANAVRFTVFDELSLASYDEDAETITWMDIEFVKVREDDEDGAVAGGERSDDLMASVNVSELLGQSVDYVTALLGEPDSRRTGTFGDYILCYSLDNAGHSGTDFAVIGERVVAIEARIWMDTGYDAFGVEHSEEFMSVLSELEDTGAQYIDYYSILENPDYVEATFANFYDYGDAVVLMRLFAESYLDFVGHMYRLAE